MRRFLCRVGLHASQNDRRDYMPDDDPYPHAITRSCVHCHVRTYP